jgi:hypothetical protein
MSKNVDLDSVKRVPILDVADRLGMDLVRTGSNRSYALREDGEITSLQIDTSNNRWKRFSGVERGGVNGGSVIDLVMHMKETDFKSALEWFTQNFK